MTSTYSSNPPYFQFNNAIITGGVFNVHTSDYRGFEVRSHLLRRLRPRGYLDYLAVHRASRLPNTCSWILDHSFVKKWLGTDEATRLCIYGGPGTGKSVLASFLVDHLKSAHEGQGEATFFYFCKTLGASKDKGVHAMMQIIRDCIVRKDRSYDIGMAQQLSEMVEGEREDYQFTIDELGPYCRSFLSQFTRIRIVLDALDECEDPRPLVEFLSGVPGAWIIVLSRPEVEVQSLFSAWPSIQLGAERTTEGDITSFIQMQIANVISEFPILQDLAQEIEQKLQTAAGQMFLFAKLKCETIRDQQPSTRAQLPAVLKLLDAGEDNLDNLYQDYLKQRLQKNSHYRNEVALRTLQWVTFSPTLPSLTFLQRVLAIDLARTDGILPDKIDFDIRNTISRSLGALLQWQTGERDLYATVIHQSFKEFVSRFSSSVPEWGTLETMWNTLQRHASHCVLLTTCSRVLSQPTVWDNLQMFHDSADGRRQLYNKRRRRFYRQMCVNQPWDIWEQYQFRHLEKDRLWRKAEIKRLTSILDEVKEADADMEWVRKDHARLAAVQEADAEVRANWELNVLTTLTTMRERPVLLYAFEHFATHLAQMEATDGVRIMDTVLFQLVPRWRFYAARLCNSIALPRTMRAQERDSARDVFLALRTLSDVLDAIEELGRINPRQIALHLRMSMWLRHPFCWREEPIKYSDVWNKEFVDPEDLRPDSTFLFDFVTRVIFALVNIERSLSTFNATCGPAVGIGIVMFSIHHCGTLLSQWTAFHLLKLEDLNILSSDHYLFPKLRVVVPLGASPSDASKTGDFKHSGFTSAATSKILGHVGEPPAKVDDPPLKKWELAGAALAVTLVAYSSRWSMNLVQASAVFSLLVSTKAGRFSFQPSSVARRACLFPLHFILFVVLWHPGSLICAGLSVLSVYVSGTEGQALVQALRVLVSIRMRRDPRLSILAEWIRENPSLFLSICGNLDSFLNFSIIFLSFYILLSDSRDPLHYSRTLDLLRVTTEGFDWTSDTNMQIIPPTS